MRDHTPVQRAESVASYGRWLDEIPAERADRRGIQAALAKLIVDAEQQQRAVEADPRLTTRGKEQKLAELRKGNLAAVEQLRRKADVPELNKRALAGRQRLRGQAIGNTRDRAATLIDVEVIRELRGAKPAVRRAAIETAIETRDADLLGALLQAPKSWRSELFAGDEKNRSGEERSDLELAALEVVGAAFSPTLAAEVEADARDAARLAWAFGETERWVSKPGRPDALTGLTEVRRLGPTSKPQPEQEPAPAAGDDTLADRLTAARGGVR